MKYSLYKDDHFICVMKDPGSADAYPYIVIAKNDLNGSDSPEGRKLNRRIEIRIVTADGQIVWDLVEAIAVPQNLKVD